MSYTPIVKGTPNWDNPVNAAFTNIDAEATAAQAAAIAAQSTANSALATAQAATPNTGTYIPASWGSFWKTARNNASNQLARVAVVGSSSAQGLYSSNLITTSWVGRLITQLQTNYGNGGSGFFAASRSATFLGASATTTGWQGQTGNLVTTSGSWSVGNPYGPGGTYIFSQTNGNTVTFIVSGTKIRVYTIGGSGRQPWTYSIDGASAVSVSDPGGVTQVAVQTITGLSAGSHTIVLTHNGTNGASFAVCGVTGENNTGVVVNNYGLSGAQSNSVSDFSANYLPGSWEGGPNYPADLLIYTLGANDANAGVSGDTWATNLRNFLSFVKDGTPISGSPATGNTDILIMLQHIGTYDTTNLKWQDYAARARTIADSFGAAFLNIWPLGRNSWNYWNGLGYWGNAAAAGGGAGTDVIHMSDAGHQYVANQLIPILTAA